MKQIKSNYIGVDQGSLVMFSDFQDDGKMWAGEGPRMYRRKVRFSGAYREPPAVHVSLSMWDTDADTNQRADITAEKVTTQGFELVFRTWGDSRVARVRADWTSIGELRHADDWDVD
jgi:hypothetical protein